jgi:hypothetical protein
MNAEMEELKRKNNAGKELNSSQIIKRENKNEEANEKELQSVKDKKLVRKQDLPNGNKVLKFQVKIHDQSMRTES